MQSIETSKSIVYETKDIIKPTYQFQTIREKQGLTALTIDGTQKSITYTIPAEHVFNLSKSIFAVNAVFDLPEVDYINNRFDNTFPYLYSIELRTRDGVELVNIPWHSFQMAILNRAITPLNDLLTNSTSNGGLYRLNNDGKNERFDNSSSFTEYTEMRYSTKGAEAVEEPFAYYTVPLGLLGRETLLELDKDLYFGKELELTFTFNSREYVGWKSEPDRSNPEDLDIDIKLSDIKFMLAIEKDQVLRRKTMDDVKTTGINLIIPFLTVNKTSIEAFNHNITKRFNRNDGNSLLRIYSSWFNYSIGWDQLYESNSLNTSLLSYNTSVNDEKIQLEEIDIIDSYLYNKDFIEKSALQSRNEFRYNWYHVDDFSGKKGSERTDIYKNNILSGMPISEGLKYNLSATFDSDAYQYDWYLLCVSQKVLRINSFEVSLL